MGGEIPEMERTWREAEEIANIADSLLVPEEIETRLAALREKEEDRTPTRSLLQQDTP